MRKARRKIQICLASRKYWSYFAAAYNSKVYTLFSSPTPHLSHLLRANNTVNLIKKDEVVHRIPCE